MPVCRDVGEERWRQSGNGARAVGSAQYKHRVEHDRRRRDQQVIDSDRTAACAAQFSQPRRQHSHVGASTAMPSTAATRAVKLRSTLARFNSILICTACTATLLSSNCSASTMCFCSGCLWLCQNNVACE